MTIVQDKAAPAIDASLLEQLTIDDLEFTLSAAEAADPDMFLDSERGKAWITKNGPFYHTRYYLDRGDHMDIERANKVAAAVLEAKRSGDKFDVYEALFSEIGEGQEAEDGYYESHHSDFEEAIAEIGSAIEADGRIKNFDDERWQDAVRDRVVQIMVDNDDSEVTDMICPTDVCEIVFRFDDGSGDFQISSNKPYMDFSDLAVDAGLQKALAGIGYTIGDYRKMSKNKQAPNGLAKGVSRKTRPLVSPAQLEELIDNASSMHTDIVIYAIVPLWSLINLDLNKPIALNRYAVASYNGWVGTFHDIRFDEGIIIKPEHASLTVVRGYSPHDFCGLMTRCYEAKIANI